MGSIVEYTISLTKGGFMINHEEEGKKQDGISRRQFLKFCGVVAGALGFGPDFRA